MEENRSDKKTTNVCNRNEKCKEKNVDEKLDFAVISYFTMQMSAMKEAVSIMFHNHEYFI